MEKSNKNGKWIIVVLIIVIMLVIAESGFIVYLLNKDKSNEVTEADDFSVEEKVEENNKITELNVDDEMVINLHEMIPEYSTNKDILSAYQSKKITMNELDNSFMLAFAFRRIDVTMEEKEPFEGSYDWYYFSPEVLQAEVKKIFGTEIPNESFVVAAGSSCKYENEKYLYSFGGGSGMGSTSNEYITKAYIEGEKLYIEDRYLYLVEYSNGGSYDNPGIFVYDSSDKVNKIAEYPFNLSNTNNIFEENKSNMKAYRHTFTKGDNGEYYWVSSEPID